jgi:hypothetical protein
MKKYHFIIIFVAILSVSTCLVAVADVIGGVASPITKLPYSAGQSFIVTQGYNLPPTHIKKDLYALDFTQNGCDAYGKAVVAVASGTVMFASEEGYNGGYGTELIVDHGNHIVSRYAHMVPDSLTVATNGAVIRQGQTLGLLGDTGLVVGAACVAHPGSHLHFAMDTVNADGVFSAYDPEPISGYTDMTVGKWYLSDNSDNDADTVAVPSTTTALPIINLPIIVATATPVIASSVAPVVPVAPIPVSTATPPPPVYIFSGGGVSVTPDVPPMVVSTTDATDTEDTSDTTSTLNVATSTQDDSATSTLNVATDTPETTSSTESSSVSVASSTGILFAQLDDSASSPQSWYDDNWFELGTGFEGELNTLTLKGAVSAQDYFASHVALQEFKDKNYTAMVQSFPISDAAPFTYTMATATFSGLFIPLKPYFYYRLSTVQDYQNRSVILAGATTTSTGTAMWNNFIYGTGRVESTEPFFPFIEMEGVFATSTLVAPPLTVPTNLAENFDRFGMQLTLSWSTSTDPDWSANSLHYETNYSTSTTLSDTEWTAPAAIPVTMGNSYLIGVRALDNYGAISAVATTTWNFPQGFSPYLLSPELSDASQYFTVSSTSTLQSIALSTANWQTGARNWSGPWCTLQLFDEYNLSSMGMTQSDNTVYGYDCAGTPTFSFASTSPVLYPSHRYHWVFAAQTGNPSTGASVQFYGTAMDTAGGAFSNPTLVNAKFTVTGDTGILFSN